ncbi:MAG: M12 family metallo-peptidase [Phycisphaerales bacterium]|nr:M12 family metallo-peptidase [Phycisphaerales bacterium]
MMVPALLLLGIFAASSHSEVSSTNPIDLTHVVTSEMEPFSVLGADAPIVVQTATGIRPARIDRSFARSRTIEGVVVASIRDDQIQHWSVAGGRLTPLDFDMNGSLRALVPHVSIETRRPCSGQRPLIVPDDEFRESGTPRGACRRLRVAFDTDREFTTDLFAGDADAAASYVLELATAVSVIYETELDLPIEVSYIRVWGDDTCPYDPTEAEEGLLEQFRSEWSSAAPDDDRHLAHLLSGSWSPASAGLAWLGVTCTAWGYAYSSALDGDFDRPPEDHSWNIWDVLVVAHEIGHNIGADHTHEMSPPIDECGNDECDDAWGGTIMSYCHLCAPNFMTNIVLDFHADVQSDIETHLSGVACNLAAIGGTDVDGDGVVNTEDVLRLMLQFGTCVGCACTADNDGSGTVDVEDLLALLLDWG